MDGSSARLRGASMKNFDSRTYSVNDFLEWESRGQLELNPRFQRRPVWSPAAKSYLIDTMLRGKPIPKIYMRQKINVSTRTTIREVVDGQQRLRTILSFLKDGLTVRRTHNEELGNTLFSVLPDDVKNQFLAYEIAADLLTNLPDSEVLDVFSRLNAYSVVLNEQELLNAKYYGRFKLLADSIGRDYLEYWTKEGIITDRQIMRMQEVSLVADLLIAMKEGIQPKKQIRSFYAAYEPGEDRPEERASDVFDEKIAKDLRSMFDQVMKAIADIFPEGIRATEFKRIHLFYSLFTAVAHCIFELPKIPKRDTHGSVPRPSLKEKAARERARNGLEVVGTIFERDISELKGEHLTFMQNTRRATTDGPVRTSRTIFLLRLMAA
jgi:hypothetical protein